MSGHDSPAPDQRPIPAVPNNGLTRDTPTRGPARPGPYVIAGILLVLLGVADPLVKGFREYQHQQRTRQRRRTRG